MRPGSKLALAAVIAVWVLAAPLLLVVTLIGATVASAASPGVCGPVVAVPAGVAGQLLDGLSVNPRVRAQQWQNAAAIVAQGAADRLPAKGLVIALMTARQESSLINVAYGDTAGPDSRGLFQQRDPWGPLTIRMDPRGAAHLFFTGGRAAGTPGLLDIPGWQAMPPWQAANRVQRSAFPTAYARWQALAGAMVAALVRMPLSPAGPASDPVVPDTDPAGLVCGAGSDSGRVAAAPGAWVSPLEAGRYTLSSPFGMRTLDGVRRLHAGQDLAVAVGTPVRAAAAGTVVFAGSASGYGYLVIVQHTDGITTRYAHLSVIRARPGPVGAGQLIGMSGGARGAPGAGHSTGPHLHFEVRQGGTPIHPILWMGEHGAPL